MCARTVNGSEKLSFSCSGTFIFLECSSMLNAASVTNTFLSYTWLSKCFFSAVFFYILTAFLFYRLFDHVLMKTYSLCGCCCDKKTFKETTICGVIASEWILFIWSFFLPSQKMIRVRFLPFSFYVVNHKKNKIFENVLEFRQPICHWNVLIVLGYW